MKHLRTSMQPKRFIAGILAFVMLFVSVPWNSVVHADARTIYGDVNRDTDVNQSDVTALQMYLAEYDIDIDLVAADVNVDGVVDLRDLLLLKQYVAGMDVILGEAVTITFHTDGGTAVAPIKLCKGATLASVIDKMPTTQKIGYIFAGWYTEEGEPIYSEDEFHTDVAAYARFIKIPDSEHLNVSSFSLLDQRPDLSFVVVSEHPMTIAEVKNALTLLVMDGTAPVGLVVVQTSDTMFTVKAEGGFNEGSSYQLILSEELNFKDKERSIRTANFTIYKEPVDNISYNEDIVFIKDTDEIDYVIIGSEKPVPVLETALLSNKSSNEPVYGYFYYSSITFSVGDILCIYENTHPRERNYAENRYEDDAMAYVEVTGISGTKVTFKSINEEDADKVFFIPDTIPYSVTILPSGSIGTVDMANYDKKAWATMGYTNAPVFNVGDFLVFFTGAFDDITEESTVYFAEVTKIEGSTVTFKQTTAEAIRKSQELFLTNPVDGDELLEHIDTDLLESQIERQAIESGFAEEAARYLANVAKETNGFKNMQVQAFTASGKKMSPLSLKNIGGSWKLSDNVKVKATIGKSSKYFNNGISLALRIDAEFSVDVGENGELKIILTATFVEEIAVDIDVNGTVDIDWIIIVPKIKSVKFGAAIDVKNYSAISLDIKVYTVENEEESLWDKLKKINKDFGPYIDAARELKQKIDEAKESADKIQGYIKDFENLWNTIKTNSNGTVTKEMYEELVGTLELNITQELLEMLNITTDEEMEAGIRNLMKRYSEMLETESEWISLVEKEIFSKDFHIYVFAINFELTFVVKANINIALGANLEYVVGKRYSFWIDVVKKTSGNSVMDLMDERFAFQFYAMGALGLKMGVEAKIAVGLISTKIGSIGVSAEFGPYVKLWGYFIYEYSKLRPANTNSWIYDERKVGALYLEFGLYLEMAFEAQVLGGLLSYNPTLLDKEFPLLTAGNRKNYYAFAYEFEEDEIVIIEDEDRNSNTGITMVLPESYRLMDYIDLVEGDLEKEVGDWSRFIITLSNRNFQLDSKTGRITVTVPQGVQYMECDLTLTWKMGKLEFASKDITITIPLVWTNLSTEEMNQKFTATVKVGNSQDGYTTVWSTRVKKNTPFNLPTEEEILALIGYENYAYGQENLKYASVQGYGNQKITDLTVYADTTYYFNVTLREYTLVVSNVQDKNGNAGDMTFTARFGESFDLSELFKSGTKDSTRGIFTSYYKTEATLNGSPILNQDITRPIDTVFAKELLSGTLYTAKYADNAVTATYKFTGKFIDIPDMTVTIEKGTTPKDVFSEELANRGIIIKSITPALGAIMSDTTFIIYCELAVIPKYWLIYHTYGGSEIEAKEVAQGALLIKPADPVRQGYIFDGWYTDSTFTEAFDFTNATMPGKQLELHAKWVAETRKITFDANEGDLPTGTSKTKTVSYGDKYGTLPTPVRTGYKFVGWYTSRTGGAKITENDTVTLLNDITLYARWQEKQTIKPNVISYKSGQKTVYNRNEQPFVFSVTGGLSKDSFEVYYKRQGIDSSYTTKAVNAGTYDIKFVRQEDEDYKYFETLLVGVYIIEKADSVILNPPEVQEIYYGNIAPKKMVYDVDYIGDGVLEFAVGGSEQYVVNPGQVPFIIGRRPKSAPTTGWSRSGVVYNIYDNVTHGNYVYLWVRLAEGENYKASSARVSADYVTISNMPKSLLSKNWNTTYYVPEFNYKLSIKTSNINQAGTDSKIYIKIGDGPFQHLDNPGNDFEKGDTNVFTIDINQNLLYNTCYGTIPVTLRYEREGSYPGWHCEWIRLDVYDGNKLDITGNTYYVNHWFGTEDYNHAVIEETYYLTGYERKVSLPSDSVFSPEDPVTLTSSRSNYQWKWTNPTVLDTSRAKQYGGFRYNPYVLLNAPEINVTFGNVKYDRFISRGVTSFTVDSQKLRQAMIEDGLTKLELTYRIEFKPVNGNRSVTAQTSLLREKKIVFNCPDAAGTTTYQVEKTARAMYNMYRGLQDNVKMQFTPGANGTFDVSYSISENAGIWGAKFAVNYDKSKLELIGYTLGNVFTPNEVLPPERYDNGRYVFFASRNDFEDTTETGKLVTLTFKIREGATFEDYPVSLDVSSTQSINAESGIVTTSVDENAPGIIVSGNTTSILPEDKVDISVSAGNSAIKSVLVKKNMGEYMDITDIFEDGYNVTENGTYTFKVVTTTGECATTTITYTGIDRVKPVVAVSMGDYVKGTWTRNAVVLTVANTAQNLGETTIMYKKDNGEWTPYTGAITISDETGVTNWSFKAISAAGIESDVETVVVKLDKSLPEGSIKVGTETFKKFINKITFGLFFKETQKVTIEGTDSDSGIAKIEYHLANGEIDDVTSISDWTVYDGSLNLNPVARYVVYARITDNVGNSVIINTDGIVVENVVPVISGVTDKKVYCEPRTVAVTDDNQVHCYLNLFINLKNLSAVFGISLSTLY